MTPQEREYLVRTMIGEAANQSDAGLAAVGHVILNRARAGNFGGKGIRDVVLAKHQFEPWNDPAARKRMLSVPRESEAYRRAARVADQILAGEEDPTGGATHFLNEQIVRQRRGGSLPKWAEKMAATAHRIGDHTFYGGSGSVALPGGEGGDVTLDMVRAEIERRKSGGGDGGVTADMVRAEIERRRTASAPQGSEPERRSGASPYAAAATAMVNDINAGFQGVNPIAVSQQSPVGSVDRDSEGRISAIDIDGAKIDPSRYTSDKYVTQVDPESGLEVLYRREAESDASMAESAGRVLGFGLPMSATRPPTAPRTQTAAEAIGVTPSLGMTGKIGAIAAGAGDVSFLTSGPVRRDATRAAGEIGDAAERIADMAGPGATQLDGGAAIQRGSGDFVDAFKTKADELYADVGRAIPKGAQIEVRNTAQQLEGALKLFENTPNIGNSVGLSGLRGWAKDIVAANGRLSWEQVSALRSEIGSALRSVKGPMADQAEGRLRQIYGALTDDMEAGAKANGAHGKWKRANSFYASGQRRIDEALDFVFKSKSDEQIFERAFALTADKGGRANIKKLSALKKSMPPEEWGEFIGTVIRRSGRPTPGAMAAAEDASFSAATFLTNWNRMSPGAKAVLFSGKGVPKTLRPALNSLAEVAESARAAGLEVNRSRTGAVLTQVGATAGLVAAPYTTIAMGVLAHLGARALTRPGLVRALASYGKTGSVGGLRRLADGRGAAAVEAGNALRLISNETR